ncbi:MAG: UDP-N-acetylmuramoyl-L-alanine--D-glutamate ligase, partial [Planctomycetota bacterium]
MDLAGKQVTVMGLGRFGGGVGVARFLLDQGARVVVTDLDGAGNLAESVDAVGPRAAYHLGGHRPEDFTDADLVVVSPAVPRSSRFVQLARAAGVRLATEISLFFE